MWPPLERASAFASDIAARATAVRESFRGGLPSPGALTTEVAKPAVTSINSPWREALQELKPIDLAVILRDAVNGNADSYLRLCEEMEEREPHYRSVLNTRKLSITGIPISIDAPTDTAHDVAIADDIQDLLSRPEAEGMVTDLLDGIAKGFSCVEIIWERDVKRWEPVRYEWRSQRHFVFDRDTLTQPRLRTASSSYEGEELQPFKWMVHRPKLTSGVPLRSGIGMPVSLAYMAKKYTIADWLTFLDVFGMPVRVGKFPASMAKRKNELLRAMQMIGTDAAAVIPEEMNVEFLEAKGSAAGGLFQATAEYWDKQTSKIVLGQTMSSDDGASLSQAKVHQEVRREIRDADARAVAATITRDLIIPFVQLNYGPQAKYPRAVFKIAEPEDVLQLTQSLALMVDRGLTIEISEVRDRLGFKTPDEDAELMRAAPEVSAKATADNAPPPPTPGDEPPKPGPGDKPAASKEPNRDESANEQLEHFAEQLQRLSKQGLTEHKEREDAIVAAGRAQLASFAEERAQLDAQHQATQQAERARIEQLQADLQAREERFRAVVVDEKAREAAEQRRLEAERDGLKELIAAQAAETAAARRKREAEKALCATEGKRSLLRLVELLSTAAKASDLTSVTTDEVLEHWHKLIDPNVGTLIEKLHAATSFDDVTAIMQELADDAGVELDIASFVDVLAKSDWKLRGVGNATDKQVV